MSKRIIRILSVDDHKMIHRAIAHMASRHPELTMVGEAQTGEEALEYMDALRPDIVLMDLNMPGIGGVEATERLSAEYPQVKIIILSAHTHEPYPSRAFAAGASGFLCKNCDEGEMYKAITLVSRGGRYVSAEVAGDLSKRLSSKAGQSDFERLSEREMAVVLKITSGYNTQSIAELLEISPNTVSSFRRRIYDKLNVSNDVELTLVAFRHRLIGDFLDS